MSVLRPLSSDLWRLYLPLGVFSILWLDLIRQLSYVWQTNEQYAYGWFVPLLALGLFLKKWPSRPCLTVHSPQSTVHGLLSPVSSPLAVVHSPQSTVHGLLSPVLGPWSSVFGPFPLSAFCFLLLFLLLPLRVIYEINQDWPLISWLYTLIVVALTLYALHLAGPHSVVSSQWSVVRGQRSTVHSPRSLVLGPQSVVSGPQSTVHSPRSPVPGPWSSVLRPWSTVNGQRSTVPGPWSLVLGPWSRLSPWLTHFAFPVCFILVAVQWPYRLENPLTKGLMRLDTNITVELLGWLNIPAIQHGNLIELATGTVGVDEACSGIRSFQSTLMAALFLGELYLLRRRTRLVLVAGGLVLAFGFNVVRTLLLAWQSSAGGTQALEKWHDPAGFTITVACFLVLWGIAVWIKKRTNDQGPTTNDHGPWTKDEESAVSSPPPAVSGPRSMVYGPQSLVSGQWSVVSGPTPASSPVVPSPISPTSDLRPLTSGISDPQPSPSGPLTSDLRPLTSGNPDSQPSEQLSTLNPQLASALCPPSSVLCRRFMLAVGLWSLLCLLATELWYRQHGANEPPGPRWTVSLPGSAPSFQRLEVAPRTANMLRYDASDTGAWTGEEGSKWTLYYFRWNPKSMQSVIRARGHRPEECLPASGLQRISGPRLAYFDAGPLHLPFNKYVFDSGGTPLFVFFCLWEDGQDQQRGMRTIHQADRLQWVLERRRHLGQQTLELILTGYQNLEEAQAAVTARLPELIKIETTR